MAGRSIRCWIMIALCVAALLVRSAGAQEQSSLVADFASLCENSDAIRNGYGCGFRVQAYHEMAQPTTTLRDVCPDFTTGSCSIVLLDYASINEDTEPEAWRQHLINIRCPPGTSDSMSEVHERDYGGLEDATTCEPCTPGFADLDGDPRTSCQMCPAGRFSGARSLLCLPCHAGSRAPAGASACISCTAGEYAPPVNDTCAPCAPGLFDHDRNPATPCATCAPGTYSNVTDLCVACEPGKHDHDSIPTTACRDCPARSESGDFPGTFARGNETQCHECASGMHDYDFQPATPCCPIACREGCTHRPGAEVIDEELFYPGDCIPFRVDRVTTSSADVQATLMTTGGIGIFMATAIMMVVPWVCT